MRGKKMMMRWMQNIFDGLAQSYQWLCIAESRFPQEGCDLTFSSRHRRRLGFSHLKCRT